MTEPRRPHDQDDLMLTPATDWDGAGSETDVTLDEALRDLSASVAYPPTPDLATVVRARLEAAAAEARTQATAPGPAAIVAAPHATLSERLASRLRIRRSVLLALVALLALAGVAAALAFSLGGLRITFAPTVPTAPPTATPTATPATPTAPPPATAPGSSGTSTAVPSAAPLGSALELGRLVTLEEAAANLGFPPFAPPSLPELGRPEAVYVDEIPAGGMISYVYAVRPGYPETTPGSGVGLIVTQFRADIQLEWFQKVLGPGTTVTQTVVKGSRAFYLTGELHAFLYHPAGAGGEVVEERFRLVGDALVWQQGELTLRLEGHLTQVQALLVAGSID